MLALIPFEAFVALYRYLCIRYVNAFKINMNYDCCFDNVKFKRYLYCIDKKESCVLISIFNLFFALQFICYLLDSGSMLIIAVAFRLRCIKV